MLSRRNSSSDTRYLFDTAVSFELFALSFDKLQIILQAFENILLFYIIVTLFVYTINHIL